MKSNITQLKKTKATSAQLGLLNHAARNAILLDIARALQGARGEILAANKRDLKAFKGSDAMRGRLVLAEEKLEKYVRGIEEVTKLPDALGRILDERTRPNGLRIQKVSVPLGVIGIIYESRPEVTIDLASLALKTGNAIVLKGGKESYLTNRAIVSCIHAVLKAHRVSSDAVFLVDPKSDWKKELLNAHGLIDLLVPRGGAGLIHFVRENSRIPIIETGAGVCHILVDESYNVEKAVPIIVNAKVQSPGVCNALDTLVVHEKIASQLLPRVAAELAQYGAEIFADPQAFKILSAEGGSAYGGKARTGFLRKARPEDFGHEFLSLKMAVKTVKSFAEGLAFVQKHSSAHTEAILTEDEKHARKFLSDIDAAVVIHNASTRFTDGGEFGMGAEVGISTQKLHARGPMGIDTLTSYKWILRGDGQIRQ
ncbi:MAG: glutamate-5-semialdehyde dehydrogenase [bacterium]|nr:glutamate-5-semialdehyde dehydrogenase [bacterium]